MVQGAFESNCAEYDIRSEQNSYRMQTDCLFQCYSDNLKDKFNIRMDSPNILIRKELASLFSNKSIDFNYENWNVQDSYKHYVACSKRCKPECSTKQYFTDIKEELIIKINSGNPGDISDLIDYSIINIEHNSYPDVIVRHSLEITLMSFVCNFGGLLGMWLGFSVLSITKVIFHSIRPIFRINAIQFNSFNTKVFQKFQNHQPKNDSEGINVIETSNQIPQQNNLSLIEIE